MSEARKDALRKTLAFAAVAELGTGLALLADPAILAMLLLGTEISGAAVVLGRAFGIALLGLGLACWPNRGQAMRGTAAYRGMLAYSAMIALLLVYAYTGAHLGGWLLWPAVALHTGVTFMLLWARRAP
jgi:hypothetical protein